MRTLIGLVLVAVVLVGLGYLALVWALSLGRYPLL